VNKDGAVDVVDAMFIQQVSVGKVPNSIFNNKLADVNNDGIINILDASCVQRYAAGYTKKIGEAGKNYEDITPASADPQIMD
ncbi:MAG: dockerin type I repeat-containing protein, partial [Ruminococcus sp.]|nr:dockerin type I repeat-containing protein [Ruminococcus sp.]